MLQRHYSLVLDKRLCVTLLENTADNPIWNDNFKLTHRMAKFVKPSPYTAEWN